jgi:HlyD family secretion protein
MTTAKKDTIISTVTGSGQVSASSQIDLKSKAAGDVIYVGAKAGQSVSAGTLLFEIDPKTAKLDLDNAKITLAKLVEPADQLSVTQAQNAVNDAIDSQVKALSDSFTSLTATFIDFPVIMTGFEQILNNQRNSPYLADSSLTDQGRAYKNIAVRNYYLALDLYNKNLVTYHQLDHSSATSTVKAVLYQTTQTAKATAQAAKDINTLVSYVRDNTDSGSRPTAMTTDLSNLSTWNNQVTSDLDNISSIYNTLNNADRTITEKAQSLTKLQDGADTLDIQSAQLAVQQKQWTYDNYFIRAPFDGIVGNVNVNKLDNISAGATMGIFITQKQIATISLNEVDAAKVKNGQKVTLTFDAIDGLTISGEVLSVDQVGTVSSGVVTYNVKIGFDTQDTRVKPGMSVSASIITDIKQDVLTVPNSAVKTSNNQSYVLMFSQPLASSTSSTGVETTLTPYQQTVTVGLSNDTVTEITSGLKEGDEVVSRTVTSSTTSTSKSTPNILSAATGRSGAGAGR